MQMVDIGGKKITQREAVAAGTLSIKPGLIKLIKAKKIPKGDVLEAARLAGIFAAKNTSQLIPLCHPIPVEFIDISFSLGRDEIGIISTVRGEARTGMEMEALSAVALAALTIYDMCKPIDSDIVISKIRLLKKSGGKSGTYVRK